MAVGGMNARCQGRRSVSDKAVTPVAQHRRRKLGPGFEALSDLPFFPGRIRPGS